MTQEPKEDEIHPDDTPPHALREPANFADPETLTAPPKDTGPAIEGRAAELAVNKSWTTRSEPNAAEPETDTSEPKITASKAEKPEIKGTAR